MNEYPEITVLTFSIGGYRMENTFTLRPDLEPYTAGGMEVRNNTWRASTLNGELLVLINQNGINVNAKDVQIFRNVLIGNAHLQQNAQEIADMINDFWNR